MMSSNCLWAFQKELLDESENIRFGKTVWEATKVVAVFSFMIEFTQLLFHLGTFQISILQKRKLGLSITGAKVDKFPAYVSLSTHTIL